ncbi:phosphoglucosamine mutase [Myxococcota bacterium]|nr:phosphoglucosamine mutase [Myxococcota bacterium]
MSSTRLFGTDGVRGPANRPPLHPEGAVALGRAFGLRLGGSDAAVVVGRDTRLSSPMLADAFRAGLCSSGAAAVDVGVLPTPAVAGEVIRLGAAGGAMVTASHNPASDNGIKLFGPDGAKAPDDVEEAVEAGALAPRLAGAPLGIGRCVDGWAEAGRCYVRGLAPWRVDASRLVLAVDAAHGAAAHLAVPVLEATGARVFASGIDPDGLNVNAGVGATHPGAISERVREHRADVGIALDGDGDRLLLADRLGEAVDGDRVLGILALHRLRSGRGLPGDVVVGTVMSNAGLEAVLRERGIGLVRAPVGDRHVAAALRERGAVLGGEPSGHVILADEAPTGDGLRAALSVLAVMVQTGRTLADLAAEIPLFPQVNRTVPASSRPRVADLPRLAAEIVEVGRALEGRGRVLVRWSGTEPKLRVMVEGREGAEAAELADRLCRVAFEELAERGASPAGSPE